MKFKGIIILLSILTISFSGKSQAELPITGTFKVQAINKNEVRNFDKIVITKDGYSLINGENTIGVFKVIAKNSEGYLVEQYFEENLKKDKPRFTVSLDITQNEVYHITVFRGNRTEKLQLIKIK